MTLDDYLLKAREMVQTYDVIIKRWNSKMNGQPTDDTLKSMNAILGEYNAFMESLSHLTPPPEYFALQTNIEKGVRLAFQGMEIQFLFGKQWRDGQADMDLLEDAEQLLNEASSAMDNVRAIAWEQK